MQIEMLIPNSKLDSYEAHRVVAWPARLAPVTLIGEKDDLDSYALRWIGEERCYPQGEWDLKQFYPSAEAWMAALRDRERGRKRAMKRAPGRSCLKQVSFAKAGAKAPRKRGVG